MVPKTYTVGQTEITKVFELALDDFAATQLLPGLSPQVLLNHPEWLDERIYDPGTGKVKMSVHTWAVRHEGQVILVDTGAGNDKSRPGLKVLDHLHLPFLQRLAAVGIRPEEVDYILLTHIHADHIGWNTQWVEQAWLPTFPNAQVICSDLEWQYGAALTSGDEEAIRTVRQAAGLGEPVRLPVPGVFADSMLPVQEVGRVRRIAIDGSEVLPGIRFLPTPGHSICHAAISISSQQEEAIFGGDVLHHPFELYDPNLVSMFCEFPDSARASRRWLAEAVADRKALYFSSHFPASSAGHIHRNGEAFHWEFKQ